MACDRLAAGYYSKASSVAIFPLNQWEYYHSRRLTIIPCLHNCIRVAFKLLTRLINTQSEVIDTYFKDELEA